MLDNHEHIAYLVNGFNNGSLIAKEQAELNEWVSGSGRNTQLFQELSDPNRLRDYLKQLEGYDESGVWDKIKEELPITIAAVRKLNVWRKIAVAASILLTLGLGSYFLFFNKERKQNEIARTTDPIDIIAPQTNRAMITMANGEHVYLDSALNGKLLQQNGIEVVKLEDGKIIYSGSATEVVYNTLSNPRGSKVIDMTLVDGSHVWLNAGSSVTYPVAFVGKERKVSVTGEAYFEVAHDATKPFYVTKEDMQVQVLGTKFNVNAYDDERDIKVTLLEGSVKTSNKIGSIILKPGQQARLISNQQPVISNPDLEEVMAWKNGLFSFNRADIKTVIRQLARWYDVEVVYEGTVTKDLFGGDIQRNLSLSKVLDFLQKSQVHFVLDGKKLTVMP